MKRPFNLIHRHLPVLALAAIGAGALTAAVALAATPGGSEPAKPHPTPVAPLAQMDVVNQPGVYERLSPAKKAEVDSENARLETAAAGQPSLHRTPGAGENNHPTPVPRTQPGAPAGAGTISPFACGSWVKSHAMGGNNWFETFADHRMLVCSGLDEPGGQVGMLFVVAQSPDGGALNAKYQPPQQWYPTPSAHGGVTITGATGEVLIVRATDGTLFYFDVGKLAYVDGPPPEATPRVAASRASP